MCHRLIGIFSSAPARGSRAGALSALEEMGAAAAPALPRLRELRAAPRRPGNLGSGWRDVADDRDLLALLDRAIARVGGG
ncbi:hypothetical protein [Nocardiopsis changdeensis]|uniref:hypothetical protein n=1 Tax=Nocardiopsis changdeensis TaxID=2831969 RepID=UPI003F45C953